jgi:hypothetical protein
VLGTPVASTLVSPPTFEVSPSSRGVDRGTHGAGFGMGNKPGGLEGSCCGVCVGGGWRSAGRKKCEKLLKKKKRSSKIFLLNDSPPPPPFFVHFKHCP